MVESREEPQAAHKRSDEATSRRMDVAKGRITNIEVMVAGTFHLMFLACFQSLQST